MSELSSDDLDWIEKRIEDSLADLKKACESIGAVGGRLYGTERIVKAKRQRRRVGLFGHLKEIKRLIRHIRI